MASWQSQAKTQTFSAGPGLDYDLGTFLGKKLKASPQARKPAPPRGRFRAEGFTPWPFGWQEGLSLP